MHAVYLQSVRSPRERGAALRDVARYRQRRRMQHRSNVYSQPVDSDDDEEADEDYVEDSFCVNGSVDEPQGELVSLYLLNITHSHGSARVL